ncbi:hypothetical protein NQX30_01020 [Candidatus Persebacteraceae bacterium Df01]|uniref:Uncharacterized protein n=1 Tax=Candidatus Doriopsillibacter californiensis TaxID=2970740 RepID=A0ABT7QKM6_9GAMM|nr:hypothetical protein [Candidatus Persebacteraceae bacterium Df01]
MSSNLATPTTFSILAIDQMEALLPYCTLLQTLETGDQPCLSDVLD